MQKELRRQVRPPKIVYLFVVEQQWEQELQPASPRRLVSVLIKYRIFFPFYSTSTLACYPALVLG